MEMGKLTAKLRDAVPVCFLVEGREIKRYKNIDIPDELKNLECQDFKFDVPTTGTITFKISFAPGVLPEDFPKERKRRTRTSKDAPVVLVSTRPDATSMKVSAEEAQDTTNIITLKGDPMVKISVAKFAGDEAANLVEIQASEEASPETISDAKAQEDTPANMPAANPKKASAKGNTN